MTKKLRVTKQQITTALREATFAPSRPGPLKVIIDVGDHCYYMVRAQELLTLASGSPSTEQCVKYLNMALSLIAISKVRIQNATFAASLHYVSPLVSAKPLSKSDD